MSSGRIEYVYKDGTLIFNLIGELRAHNTLCFDDFIEYLTTLNSGEILSTADPQPSYTQQITSPDDLSVLFVDVNEATYLDSTALGLLAKLGVLMQSFGIQAVMFSKKADITTLVKTIGLGKLYTILACSSEAICTTTLEQHAPDQQEMLKTVLDAHKALMTVSINNKVKFSPLIAQLETQTQPTSSSKENS